MATSHLQGSFECCDPSPGVNYVSFDERLGTTLSNGSGQLQWKISRGLGRVKRGRGCGSGVIRSVLEDNGSTGVVEGGADGGGKTKVKTEEMGRRSHSYILRQD